MGRSIAFSKLHGVGNDFIIMDASAVGDMDITRLSSEVCDRHFGIGADGLMLVAKSEYAEVKMIYFNSDGSRAEICGNGIRCFAKYVFDKQIVPKKIFVIETLAGIIETEIEPINNKEAFVKADIGTWDLRSDNIPVISDERKFIMKKLDIGGECIEISCVRMGVPHAVIFVNQLDQSKTITLGNKIEGLKIFPDKINVNFVQIINKKSILVQTWERGAGKTLACGTGASASVIIGNHLGLIDREVCVNVPGGRLNINLTKKNRVLMGGMAELICDGIYYTK